MNPPNILPQPHNQPSPQNNPQLPSPNVLDPTTNKYLDSTYSDLSNYKIEKKIGKGQFSEVIKAVYMPKNQLVALKLVKIFEMMDAKTRTDCIKEIDLLKQLDHPNVIKYLASFVANNELHIVLELADAGDLSKMIKHFKLKRRLIPERTVWKYFSQIAGGLNHMHERRIMHRDIKPANVFITAQGIAKLGDLGLGRYFNTLSTAAHSLVGTPYYMSPERLHERPYNIKSDIWSLGCLLYELGALHSPFYGDNMNLYMLCKKIEKCEYTQLSTEVYSKELNSLINHMIQSDPKNRPDCKFIEEYSCQMLGYFQSQKAGSSEQSSSTSS